MNETPNFNAEIFKDFLKQKTSSDCNVKGDFPIRWFGDSETLKPVILTIGMRPSSDEYGFNRFPAAPLNFYRAYNEYFRESPNQLYFGWQNGNCLWEGLVNQLGASYYDDENNQFAFQAIHTNIFPFISDVKKTSEASLELLRCSISLSAFAVASSDSFDYLEKNDFFEPETVHILHSFVTPDSYTEHIKVGKTRGKFVFSIPTDKDILMRTSTAKDLQELYALFNDLLPSDATKLAAIFRKCGITVQIGHPNDTDDSEAITLPDLKTVILIKYPDNPNSRKPCDIYPNQDTDGWYYTTYLVGRIEELLERIADHNKKSGLSEISFSVPYEKDPNEIKYRNFDEDDDDDNTQLN